MAHLEPQRCKHLSVAIVLVAALCSCRESKRPVKAREQPPEPSPFPLHTAKRVGNSALLDFVPRGGPDRSWPSHCKIHQDCQAYEPLPRCSTGLNVIEASKLDASPPTKVGEQIAVRGELVVAEGPGNLSLCVNLCCPSHAMLVFVGRPPGAILLADAICKGDESRVCCPVAAFGQSVIAVGVLQGPGSFGQPFGTWVAEPYGVNWALGGTRVARTVLCADE